MPTKNSKVCGLHFVSGIAINNPESVDYVPSVNVGYEKHVSARETQTSKRAKYWSNSDLAASLDRHGRRQESGIVTPDIGSEVRLGSLEEPRKSPFFIQGVGHTFITTINTNIITVFSISATPL